MNVLKLTGTLMVAGWFGLVGAVSARAAEGESLSEGEKAAHVLNRLGYGPRPGEVDQVEKFGVEKWIRGQLRPEKIPDTRATSMVDELTFLKKTPKELTDAYRAEIRARRQNQQAKAAEKKAADAAKMNTSAEPEMADAMMSAAKADEKKPRAPKPRKDAANEAAAAEGGKPAGAGPNGPGEEEHIVARALGELHHAKLTRAVFSERQLEQVLVDFWFNHFNVDARKQQVRAMVVSYEQDVIRPNIWGSFRDLLGATAKSPAMLVFLDNWQSSVAYEPADAEVKIARRVQQNATGMSDAEAAALPKPTRGLNENYGRELMELHTLGATAGYTQKDVQEVARAFTGWTLNPRTGEFHFRTPWHDQGEKVVLGKRLPASGGQKDGEQVLDLLATHPATGRRIAYKLCQRFVADAPPDDMVKRVAGAFLKSGGNLRATYEALFTDRDFFAPQNFGAKTKSPFEFAVSALRASDAAFIEVKGIPGPVPLRALEAGALLGRGQERMAKAPRKTVTMHVVEMGQANYGWGPPTGYSEDSSTWVNSGALVSRLNYALALTGGQVADARVHARALLDGKDADMADEAVDTMARNLFARPLSDATRRVVLAQSGGGSNDTAPEDTTPVANLPRVLALMLGAPEFQRR